MVFRGDITRITLYIARPYGEMLPSVSMTVELCCNTMRQARGYNRV
jgi:hypothetical protein